MTICGQALPIRSAQLAALECSLIAIFVSVLYAITRLRDGFANAVILDIARVALIVFTYTIVFFYIELFHPGILSRERNRVSRVLQGIGLVCLLIAGFYVILPALGAGPLGSALLAPMLLVPVLSLRNTLSSSPMLATQRVAMVGKGRDIEQLAHEIENHPEWAIRMVPFEKLDLFWAKYRIEKDLFDRNSPRPINSIVISSEILRDPTLASTLLVLKTGGMRVEYANTYLERLSGRVPIDDVSVGQMLSSNGFAFGFVTRGIKRLIDISVASTLFLLTLPVLLLAVLGIFLESGRPVFYIQKRVGLRGRVFKILKLRTMLPEARKSENWTSDSDPRITKLGRTLRKFRIDELPQLINVVRGEMSMVGPRPEQPQIAEMLSRKIPYFNLRHSVRPGLTGLAQVRYQYGASIEQSHIKVEHDLFYIKHLTVWMDLVILASTFKTVLLGRGAK